MTLYRIDGLGQTADWRITERGVRMWNGVQGVRIDSQSLATHAYCAESMLVAVGPAAHAVATVGGAAHGVSPAAPSLFAPGVSSSREVGAGVLPSVQPLPEHRYTSALPEARVADPDTSWEAASLAVPHMRENHRYVLEALSEGAMTDFQLAEWVSNRAGRMIGQTSIGVRRHELAQAGLVEDSGSKGFAPSGARAICWRLTPAGDRAAAGLVEAQKHT